MTVVLVLCGTLLAAAGGWGAHRRSESLAWNRELDLAFDRGEPREVPRHRML